MRDMPWGSPEQGPGSEERKSDRLRDALNGLVYFDTFEELESWESRDIDPIQCSNTQLLERSLVVQSASLFQSKSRVLLCHDFKGGYHDYETVHPIMLANESYSCEYLQFVDMFIYFSHKLVCIPPSTWTNTMHRNGIKILGTFILEPQSADVERLFRKTDDEFVVVRQLTSMAAAYGFDGWLVNIEKVFERNVTTDVISLLVELKKALGDKYELIWYDALTSSNKLDYQNALTAKNVQFSQAAGELFTNYRWDIKEMDVSLKVAREVGMRPRDIFFGIDVWAQNTNMPGPPRITYPVKGGGGTNTGFATKAIAEHGLSTAIFAPGWPYEHFDTTGDVTTWPHTSKDSTAKKVNLALWEGAELPKDLGCDCKEGKPHQTNLYQDNPIVNYAQEYASGTDSYFYTDFRRPYFYHSGGFLSMLGSQSPLPNLLSKNRQDWDKQERSNIQERVLYAWYFYNTTFTYETRLKISTKMLGQSNSSSSRGLDNKASTPERASLRLQLYKLNMDMDLGLRVTVSYCRQLTIMEYDVGLYTTYIAPESSQAQHSYHVLPIHYSESEVFQFVLNVQPKGSRLIEIGFYCNADYKNVTDLVDFMALSILPADQNLPVLPNFTDIKIIAKPIGDPNGSSSNSQLRLAWNWSFNRELWPKSLPWSDVTGPFSYVEVYLNNRWIGNSYALEFPLLESDIDSRAPRPYDIGVRGRTWGDVSPRYQRGRSEQAEASIVW